MLGSLFSVLTLGLALVGQISWAAPASEIQERQSITTVSAATITALTPYGEVQLLVRCSYVAFLTGLFSSLGPPIVVLLRHGPVAVSINHNHCNLGVLLC